MTEVASCLPVLLLPAAPRKAPHALPRSAAAGRSWLRQGLPAAPLALARAALSEVALWAHYATEAEIAQAPTSTCASPDAPPAGPSPKLLLARIPRHIQPFVFAAYCAWMCEPGSTAGLQFEDLLEVCPWLDLAVYRHAARALPHLASSPQQWRDTVALGIRDAAAGEKLVAALQASLPCPARRVLRF